MHKPIHALPRIAIQSIGFGLLLMALFTMMWTGIAQGGLLGHDNHLVLVCFASLRATFAIYGIKTLFDARKFPSFTSDTDKAKGKKMLKWFGIIFGIEFTLIPIICALLYITSLQQYVLPAIALIVGLHFFPMAFVFDRKIDFYLASWTCIVAISSIILIIDNSYQQLYILSFLGVGVAMATATYGLFMLFNGHALTQNMPQRKD